jgi:hypothetical protein
MTDPDPQRTMVLEAFADTIIPGDKRFPGDRAVAGVSPDGGAVAAGAIELLEHPAGGLAAGLDSLALALNVHADDYALRRELTLDASVPSFVALAYDDRVALIEELTDPGHPEKQMWVGLALFSNMAYDSAAHLSTPKALADGHPGLTTLGYEKPQPDGLWRFPEYSYGRKLADLHPATTTTGHPA